MHPNPIYTSENCRFAYQLRWAVTLFLRNALSDETWRNSLAETLESKDSIRILKSRTPEARSRQFVLSTQPGMSPQDIIQRLKGRLSFLLRHIDLRLLRPHYSIRSFGTQTRKTIEAYIAQQPSRHMMADHRVQRTFEELLYCDPSVDLSAKQTTTHGCYWYNLHIVVEHVERWHNVNVEQLRRIQRMLINVCQRKGWRMSRLAILADHVHMLVGGRLNETPASIVLSLMNNIAWIHDMSPVLSFSAFVGTTGEYDQRAVER